MQSGFEFNLKDATQARLHTIATSVQLAYTSAVEGDIAEFGIFRGRSWQVIAAVMRACEPVYAAPRRLPPKTLHGFDSFKGLPAATHPADTSSPMVAAGAWAEGTCPSSTMAEIAKIGAEALSADRIRLYPGWFSETLPMIPPDTKFALVHLDCDLYESTAQVLSELFANKRVSDGCILMFDDFFENRSSKKFGQRRAWEECKSRFALDVTDLGYYGGMCWRCIVHAD